MKRFVTKLSAVALSVCMLVPTLSNSAAISYGNAADDTKSSDLLFNNEDQFFVYVGTYKNSVPQFRYLYPTSDGSYNADKVIWENAPAGLAYGDIFVAEGDVPMTQVYPAKDDPANAHVYYYTLDEGAELIKAGNCPDLMEKKDMSVTSKTYDGSSHWSIRYMDAAGKEYYYGLSTFASSLGLDPLDCEVGDVYTYALYNDHMVVPLAKQTGTITDTMTVEVVEVHDKYLLVKPTDRPNSNERLTLSMEYIDTGVNPSVGMKYEVTYTDGILETYPEQFGNVKKVSLVSDDSIASGDVNNDGAFNISDVVLLQKWLLAVPDTHLANWKAADFCEDNKLDVFDLCLMKRALIYKSDVAVRDSNSIAGKTFTYEKSADPGIYDDLCDLSFGSNGTYIYHIGYYTSNNHDQGTWKISGDTLVLTGRYGINKFRYENNALVYIADGSDGFSEFNDKSTPKDGDKFNLAEEPDYAAINNLSEIVTIKTDYNPIMSDWSGIGILLEFDSKDYSISLRTNDGHFTTWDIAKGSGPIKNAGVTYDIGNSGYIFWTPDGFEFDADYQNEIVIIGEKDGKSVKLGSIIVTPSNNHTLTAALK